MIACLGVASSNFYHWRSRCGKVNEHHALAPRDHWLDSWEKTAILDFEQQHPLEGYRRLAFVMRDQGTSALGIGRSKALGCV
jgi:hypothetical protein